MMAQMNRLVRVGGASGCVLMGGSGLALLRLVDCRFFSGPCGPCLFGCSWGGVFFTSCVVSPGKEERKPVSISLRSVEGTGGPMKHDGTVLSLSGWCH